MKRLVAIAALAVCGSATAQDQPERAVRDLVPELTMTLIPANAETLAAVTAKIELPKDDRTGNYVPSAQGVQHDAPGLDKASVARENGRAFGEAAAAAARDNRQIASRAFREQRERDGFHRLGQSTEAAASQLRGIRGVGTARDLHDADYDSQARLASVPAVFPQDRSADR